MIGTRSCVQRTYLLPQRSTMNFGDFREFAEKLVSTLNQRYFCAGWRSTLRWWLVVAIGLLLLYVGGSLLGAGKLFAGNI